MDNIANWQRFIFLYTVFLIHMIYPTISRLDFAKSSCPDARSYITPNSTYQENLETLLSSVSSDPQFITYGVYNHSAGEEPNRVNAVALCIGDISMDICRVCVDESSRRILEVCPNQKAAIVWYDQCLLRYSGSANYNWGRESIFNGNKASSDPDKFVEAVKSLMGRLREEAASGDSTRKLGWGEISTGNETVYGLVQCIPDMSYTDCESCVGDGLVLISDARIGGRIFMGGCVLRYENYIFSNLTTNASPSSSLVPIAGSKKSKGKITVIIVIVVSILTTVILFIGICLVLRMRRRKCKIPSDEVQIKGIAFQETTDEISNVETIQFDLETIKVATNEFSDENKLGEGGFGVVYKGKLSNGQNIAVKRLSRDSNQGDLEFKNEVLVVAKLQHRNLVKLLGFSLDGNERLLIYEFLPNGSLDHFIFDHVKRTILDWETRYKIINGIARGLLYLHEDSRVRIIHRDLKTSNILLDGKMNPKIADFGMARLFELDETQAHTKRIVGTYGYMAPEYAYQGQFSPKSDVFSFGVLILEIISGQKNICFCNGEEDENLLSFAWKSWRAGKPENVIDTILTSGSDAEIVRCIHIGLLCVQENMVDRPTMASVVLMLNSCSLTLSIPSEPAFFLHTNNYNSNVHNSQTAPLPTSENGISVSDFYPR